MLCGHADSERNCCGRGRHVFNNDDFSESIICIDFLHFAEVNGKVVWLLSYMLEQIQGWGGDGKRELELQGVVQQIALPQQSCWACRLLSMLVKHEVATSGGRPASPTSRD